MSAPQQNDGGPAFPVADYDHDVFVPNTIEESRRLLSGMSLRDHFAAQALNGMLAGCPHNESTRLAMSAGLWAKAAYAMADAMLAERAK